MWKKTIWILLAVLLTTGWSCSLGDDKDPIIVPVLEDEFYLDLWQEASPSGPSLVIEFRTLADEECLNAEVLSSYDRNGRALTLKLYEILAPETCIPGNAPATGRESLAGLIPGTFDFTIDLQDLVRNEGKLVVEGDHFLVDTPTNGFQWLHGRMERIPANALWGYLSYTTEEERQWAEAQLADLYTISSDPAWINGYYGPFELQRDGTFSLAERLLPEGADVLPILLQREDATAFDNWINGLNNTLPEGVSLFFFDGLGQTWNY